MADYQYRAKDSEGKEVKGALRAPNEERARALLRSNDLTPLEVANENKKASFFDQQVFSGGVKTKDLVLFSRQMSSMIDAGVPILEALKAFEKQVEKPAMIKLLADLVYEVEGGQSFSNALSKYPDTFSLFYLGVVRTGEASGQLSKSLGILADYLEQNYVFSRKVRSALMYPAFVLVVVIIISVMMFAFVMPQLLDLFGEAGVRLPLPTRVLIVVTRFIQNFWYVVVLFLAVAGVLLRSYLKTPEGQYTASNLVLHIPVLNKLFRKVYLARMTSILHTLFSSDVPVLESMKIAQSSISNKVYQRVLDDTVQAVKDGATMSSVWENEAFIPPMLTTMVRVGERSGKVEQAFAEANRFFAREVEDILGSIAVFIEPVLVVLLAIGVGFVVSAVLLPIYNLVLVF